MDTHAHTTEFQLPTERRPPARTSAPAGEDLSTYTHAAFVPCRLCGLSCTTDVHIDVQSIVHPYTVIILVQTYMWMRNTAHDNLPRCPRRTHRASRRTQARQDTVARGRRANTICKGKARPARDGQLDSPGFSFRLWTNLPIIFSAPPGWTWVCAHA
jgi:hypothetical protein